MKTCVWAGGRRPLAMLWTVLVVLSGRSLAHAQGVRYVNAAAPAGGDGLTWLTAFSNLQTALGAASFSHSITELWIAAGTYKPAAPGGPRTATFQLRNGLALYGGFNGTETSLEQRDIALNVTTLSGDLGGDDQILTGSVVPPWVADNAYHVVTGSGVDASARLDGVTVRSGAATDSAAPNNAGGGLSCAGGSPAIDHCTFTRNFALHRGGGANLANASSASIVNSAFTFNRTFDDGAPNDGGGGVCMASSNPTFTDCHFESNVGRGGGASHGGGAIRINAAAPIITRCTFLSNKHNNYGGAIDNQQGAPVISQCAFDLNDATYGASVRSGGGQVDIRECTFVQGNIATIGAGIYFVGGTHMVVNCLFDRMICSDGGAGIAMSSGASAAVVNSRFIGNVADAFFGGGAIWNFDRSNPEAALTIVNCLFSGNLSTGFREGGAILTASAGPTLIVNCTFANNTAPLSSAGGGAVQNTGTGTVSLHNCIVVHNAASPLINTGAGAINVTFSCVEGGWPGTGNIASSIPGFADEDGPDNIVGTPDDDLRLTASSPCIDAANNMTVPADIADLDGDNNTAEPTPLDLDLRLRFHNHLATPDTGLGTPPLVDMGCYEFALPCPADIAPSAGGGGGGGGGAGDGVVNIDDLLAVIASWGPCPATPAPPAPPAACPGNIVTTGTSIDRVDVDDLLAVISAWGVCP